MSYLFCECLCLLTQISDSRFTSLWLQIILGVEGKSHSCRPNLLPLANQHGGAALLCILGSGAADAHLADLKSSEANAALVRNSGRVQWG